MPIDRLTIGLCTILISCLLLLVELIVIVLTRRRTVVEAAAVRVTTALAIVALGRAAHDILLLVIDLDLVLLR